MSRIESPGVVVCIDFKQPRAYLAHRATRALEAELQLDFDWQPLLVPALKPPPAKRAGEDRGTMHRRLRAEYNERDLARYAKRLGLPLEEPYRDVDSTAAALGLLWCRSQGPELARRYVDAVFARRWGGALDLTDPGAIDQVIRDVDGTTMGWSDYVVGAGPLALQETQQQLRDAGALDVPAYLLDGEVFLGRQHLPMLRWILTGRGGEPPL
jgi:2-hydroxychromene-2-carboxylate isomerase